MNKVKSAAAAVLGMLAAIVAYVALIVVQVIALGIDLDHAVMSTGIGYLTGMYLERWCR